MKILGVGRSGGTGYDSLSGIDSVRISVESYRIINSLMAHLECVENWFLANGTANGPFPVQGLVLEDGVTYRVQTTAYDIAGNEESPPAIATFSFDTTPLPWEMFLMVLNKA